MSRCMLQDSHHCNAMSTRSPQVGFFFGKLRVSGSRCGLALTGAAGERKRGTGRDPATSLNHGFISLSESKEQDCYIILNLTDKLAIVYLNLASTSLMEEPLYN